MKNKSLMKVLGLFVGTSLLMSSMALAGHEKKSTGEKSDVPCESKNNRNASGTGDKHDGHEEGKGSKATEAK
jgi:hypothetical protein